MRREDALKRRLINIFERNGRDGRDTRVFEHLDTTQRQVLDANVALLEGELPVIGSVESQERWLLITTARIIWCAGEKLQMFPVSDIVKVSADFEALLASGRGKLDMRELRVETLHDRKHLLPVEPGSPLIGVWNVIKHFAFLNRKIIRDLVESATDES